MKKNIKFFALAIFAVFSLFFVTATMAQTSTTGSVEGTVTDAAGAVIPSVSVTLSGPNLIRPQTVTTGADGSYRFASVPPGRYSVEVAAASGFAPFKQDNVEVNLGRGTSVNITMSPAGVGETVDVVASSEIDQTTNTTGSNISTEFFSNIPTSRTVQGLYTIAPTVARSGLRDASGRDRDPSVAGSSGPENNYILDGVNTTDPAFGGGGANLPFEFVQEVEIKTGAFGADQGLSTGGVFNVITKSGGNEFHGDAFVYGNPSNFVADTKHFPLTGLAPNGFSEVDLGGDIGGPIIKNRLTFFAAYNPQYRTNNYLTQSFREEVEGKITTPFYSGKLTWLINNNHTATFSTFGDFTKEEGHLFAGSGFGANLDSFAGTRETGGHNYSARLNSNLRQNWIGEFGFGMHFQRNNVIPADSVADVRLNLDNFAILQGDGTVAPVTHTGTVGPTNAGFVDYVFSPGGLLQRVFIRDGFGLYQEQARDRWEASARFQNIFDDHTLKYGFEFYRNKYNNFQTSSGSPITYDDPLGVGDDDPADWRATAAQRVTNNFTVCTTRDTVITCPTQAGINVLIPASMAGTLPAGFTLNTTPTLITAAEALNNPFLVRLSTRVRDFTLDAKTRTDVQSFYVQDDWRVMKNLQFNIGVRWDYQQAYNASSETYLKLNNWFDNLQPRLGFSWDPWSKGKTKIFANYARFVETPIPLDINVRAGGGLSQTDKNFNVNTYGGPAGSTIATGFPVLNLGAGATPIPEGLKPQTVNEFTAGFEHEVMRNITFGFRGIYRPQGSVIEDGSFDDGHCYFLFNPGETPIPAVVTLLEREGCLNGEDQPTSLDIINAGDVFGRARRFYRGLEFTLNRRFANNFSFNTSYVFSSLIGNYEGLFRNDNGQSDPNITSLFDLPELLPFTYGRLPNDRPHQFKFNGSYQTPFRLIVSGNFYIQSGIPYSALVPHPIYGNNEGFCRPDLGICNERGTSIIPDRGANSFGVTSAVGTNRTPTTYNLDVGLYYPIMFSENMQLRFTADFFNVTNAQRAVTLDQTAFINSGIAGVAPVENPFSGTGLVFQYPRAIRIGAKFSF